MWIDFFQRWVSNRRSICFKLLSNLPDLGGAYCRFKSRLNWRCNSNLYYNKRQKLLTALNCRQEKQIWENHETPSMIRVRGAPFPPSTLSSAFSQLRTKGFYGCLWNWASRARANAATHLWKPTTPRNSAVKSSPQSPSLPSTCSPARSPSSVVSDSNLFLCKSLFCIARKGSRRLRQFSSSRYQLTTLHLEPQSGHNP